MVKMYEIKNLIIIGVCISLAMVWFKYRKHLVLAYLKWDAERKKSKSLYYIIMQRGHKN